MQTIKRDIYVTKNVLQAPIEVTEGTNSIAIEFDVRDYDIPASAAAVAYSLSTSSMEEPNKALADVSGNKITIIPSEAFFLPGQNVMQIRIIDGNSKLISFNIIVKCTGKMRFGDEKEEQQSTLVEQMLAKLGEYQKKSASPYNFKGSCLSSELPASGNTINDTYYCTDLKYRKTWNGSAWEQSSLNEADYEDELTKTNGEVSSLKEDMARLGIKNFFDSNNLISGYIHDGVIVPDEDYKVTDYIECSYGAKIYCAIVNSNNLEAIDLFDENKQFITSYYANENVGQIPYTFTITNRNTKYIRYNVLPQIILPYNKQYLYIQQKNDYPQEEDNILYSSIKDLYVEALTKKQYTVGKDGVEVTTSYTSEWAVTDYIEIPNNCYIKWASGQTNEGFHSPACCLYDKDKLFIRALYSKNMFGSGVERINDKNVKYIRYNIVPKTNYNKQQYLTYFIPRYMTKFEAIYNSIIVSKIDNNADFSNLKDAIEYCYTHPKTNVFINDGEYDLYEELGEAYFNSITGYENEGYGLKFGYECNYIFSGGSKIIFNYNGTNEAVTWAFSPVNVAGTCTFENMQIECSNCRYCVHEDTPVIDRYNIPRNIHVTYNNCHMVHNGNNIGTYRATGCIGAGCSPNSVSKVNNGTYISKNSFALTYHLPSFENNAICEVVINGVYCNGALQTTDYPEDKQGTLLLYVSNSSLSENIITGTKTKSIFWNNVIRN